MYSSGAVIIGYAVAAPQNAVSSTDVVLPIIISLIGVVISVVVSSFIAGSRYGAMVSTLQTVSERLARIEGLFEMKLKE